MRFLHALPRALSIFASHSAVSTLTPDRKELAMPNILVSAAQLPQRQDRDQHPGDDGGALRAANYFKNKLQGDLGAFYEVRIISNGWQTKRDLCVNVRSVEHEVSFLLVCPSHSRWIEIIGNKTRHLKLHTVDYSPARIRKLLFDLECT